MPLKTKLIQWYLILRFTIKQLKVFINEHINNNELINIVCNYK